MTVKFRTPGETSKEREKFWLQKITEARAFPGGIQEFLNATGIPKELYYNWFRRLKVQVDSWQKPLETNKARRKNPPNTKSGKIASAPKTKEEWMALMLECSRSRLRPCTFARTKNINKVTFCRHYREFSQSSLKQIKASTPAKKRVIEKNKFVPLQIIEAVNKPELRDRDTTGVIEIVLANKRVIRLHGDCVPEFLRTVLTVLED